jgi:hypothetical protein
MTFLLAYLQDYLLGPILIALFGAIVVIIKKYTDKMTRHSSVKNELSSLEVSTNIREATIAELDRIVKAAVATNMSFVEELKSSGKKLSDAQIEELNKNARILIMNSLPSDLKQDDSKIMQIIGGPEALDALIKILIEKHVYEYKPQSKDNIEDIEAEADSTIADEMTAVLLNQQKDIPQIQPEEPLPEEATEDPVGPTEAPTRSTFTIPDVYKRGVG